MTLLETYCPLRATSLDEASQDVEKFSRGPPDNVPGRSRTSHTFDARSNQDTTSSDGESVGPIDSPESADSIQPELAFLVCTTVQEMESLARNCILVEESYQRYFVRNCGTQKEEAVWRQQGMREEATARQATKAISQIHINEMWARVGYYNNEAAQRSNLFRMLVLEKKKLDNDCRAENKESSSNSRQPEKRRRRPNGFCLDGSVSVEIKGMLVSLKPPEESNPVHPAATSSSSVSACRTALVHNPYSFDGPSQVTMNTALGDAGASTCSTTPSAAASTPVGGMGAVLKRIAPDPRPPPPDISKMLLQFPPPAPRTSTRAAGPTSGAQKLQVHAMLMPFLRGAAGQGRDPPKTPPGSESSPGDHPSNAEDPKPSSAPTADTLEQSSGQVEPPPPESWGTNRRCCLSRPPPEPPKLDAPPLPIEPPPPEAAVEVKDAVASEPC
eukprot:EG_transcript_12554